MKSTVILIILTALALPVVGQALPPDVAQLIQDDKYSEALARVDTLLKTTPDNAELLKIRADLAKQVPSTTAPAAASIPDQQITRFNDLVTAGKLTEAAKVADALASFYPDDPRLPQLKAKLAAQTTDQPPLSSPATPAAPAQPTGRERVAYNSAMLLLQQAQQATDATTRNNLLRRFLHDSEPIAQKYPKLLALWQTRAAVALELNDSTAGSLAAANLIKLGAIDSADPAMQELVAKLNLQGWLKTEEELAKDAIDEKRRAEQKAAADRERIKQAEIEAAQFRLNLRRVYDDIPNQFANIHSGEKKPNSSVYLSHLIPNIAFPGCSREPEISISPPLRGVFKINTTFSFCYSFPDETQAKNKYDEILGILKSWNELKDYTIYTQPIGHDAERITFENDSRGTVNSVMLFRALPDGGKSDVGMLFAYIKK